MFKQNNTHNMQHPSYSFGHSQMPESEAFTLGSLGGSKLLPNQARKSEGTAR